LKLSFTFGLEAFMIGCEEKFLVGALKLSFWVEFFGLGNGVAVGLF
jgi:hypothetical protein